MHLNLNVPIAQPHFGIRFENKVSESDLSAHTKEQLTLVSDFFELMPEDDTALVLKSVEKETGTLNFEVTLPKGEPNLPFQLGALAGADIITEMALSWIDKNLKGKMILSYIPRLKTWDVLLPLASQNKTLQQELERVQDQALVTEGTLVDEIEALEKEVARLNDELDVL